MSGVDRLAEADEALAAGRLGDALALAGQAVELLSAEGGLVHPDTANARLTLAAAHERAGRFADARRAAATAAATLDGFAECGVPEVAILRVRAQVTLANLDRILGDLTAAGERLRAAVALAEAELGPSNVDTARAYNALGIVGKFTARFDQAQAAYLRALEVYEQAGYRAGMAAVLHNLGGLEHERGRAEAGIRWAERGLALREAEFGSDHPNVAADLGALAALYERADRLPDAELACCRALVLFASALGWEHYEVAVVCGNLAVVLARQGRTGVAERLYRMALAGKAAALGDDHPELAVTLHNLGVLLADTGRRTEAVDAVNQADSLLAQRFPEDHPRRRAVAVTLGSL